MAIKLLLDEKFLWASVALIKAAKKEIYVVAYLLAIPSQRRPGKEAELYKELLAAKKRGLDCKVILNYTYPANKIVKQNTEAGKWLIYHGIECRYVARNRTVHAKMMIIDGVTLIVGSHNWSQRAVERNVEASLEVKGDAVIGATEADEIGVVQESKRFFLELWKEAKNIETAAAGFSYKKN